FFCIAFWSNSVLTADVRQLWFHNISSHIARFNKRFRRSACRDLVAEIPSQRFGPGDSVLEIQSWRFSPGDSVRTIQNEAGHETEEIIPRGIARRALGLALFSEIFKDSL